jgi:cytochrome c oxidase subunit 2
MSKIVKFAAGTTALLSSRAFAAWDLNMPVGVTELSRDIHGLHMLIFWICVVIATAVFGAMIFSIVNFRKSKGAIPASFDHNAKAEVLWTVIPIAILVGMAIPATETLIKIDDTTNSDLTVKVTGYQWKWHYDYLDKKVEFFSSLDEASNRARQVGSGVDVSTIPEYLRNVDKPLVVPVGAKVRLLLTSGDVIHAWWVPEFGMKRDALPGFVNEMWFRADKEGTFRGVCAELCGRDHGFMPIVVEVKSKQDFDSWLKSQQGGDAAPVSTAATPAATETTDATAAVAKAE